MANITRLTMVKFMELVLVCIIIGLHWNSYRTTSVHTEFISIGTMGGYLIILVGLFAGGIMGTPVNRRVDLFFSLVGCILFVTSGALIIDYFQNMSRIAGSLRDTGLAKGSMCIIEGAVFLIDAFLTFRGEA